LNTASASFLAANSAHLLWLAAGSRANCHHTVRPQAESRADNHEAQKRGQIGVRRRFCTSKKSQAGRVATLVLSRSTDLIVGHQRTAITTDDRS
jgi:hypothetical protein